MKEKADLMQKMDKIVIECNGKVNKAFDIQDGKAFDFLWTEEIEPSMVLSQWKE